MRIHHFITHLLITAVVVGCSSLETQTATTKPQAENNLINVTQSQARAAINNGAIVVDVRSAEEFSQEHYAGAINIPHTLLSQKIALLEMHRNKPIVLYCKSGIRAEVAKQELSNLGFQQPINAGGLAEIKQLTTE